MSRIRFRNLPESNQSIEMRNVGAGKSFSVDSFTIARAILEEQVLPLHMPHEKDMTEFHTWVENGWNDSIDFYLSTLDQSYADTADDFQNVHKSVLTEYNSENSIPTEQIPNNLKWIYLPSYSGPPNVTRAKILTDRRTTLVPEPAPLSLGDLSNIIWEATRKLNDFRQSQIAEDPSKALVNFGPSLDIFIIVFDISGIPSGVYRYDMQKHRIGLIKSGNFRKESRNIIVGQPATETAAASIIYVSDIKRHQWRYRHNRALRGLWIDSAKVVNEMLWSLASRQITPHITPAVNDDEASALLGLEKSIDYEVVYVISFAGNVE